ncbi:UDP-glucosyltransferase 2-like [Periplaneta americana]|uniref:UDP-glucosyltransferase 2-like n=1 Tax=Periplaneta americana TaxID=6978 RepID=UPI0037E92795
MATAQERAQAIWWYAETNSVIQVQRNFRRVFQKEPPSRNTIKTWKQYFLATGSVVKLHGGGNVRVSEECVAAVRQAYERSPRKSVRQAGRELQMPKSTMKCLNILIICALPICISEAAKILGLINFTGRSHYAVFHTYFKALAARGHQVEVYGHHPLEKPVPNYTDISMAGPTLLSDVSIDQLWGMGTCGVLTYFSINMLKTCRTVLNNEEVLNLKNSNATYDVVITQLLGSDCLIEEMLKKHFGNDCPSLYELQRSISLILVNSHFSINTPRPAVPTFVEVGGLHINSDGKLPEHLEIYLNGAKAGVIYFSMGSLIRSETFTNNKLRAFIDAFSQLPQRVLWKASHVSGLPANVKTAAWVPQLEVLNHPNVRVFITHGGNLGTQEAIYAGVPMVGIPMAHDQPLNVKNCVSKGVAVQLDYDSITTENVLKVLNKVLHDPSYRTNAKRLSQLFRDRPQSALDTAIYWTEYVIRHRGAPHLRSAALDLTWYQHLLLDVILVPIALMIVLAFMVFSSFKILLKLVRGNVTYSYNALENHSSSSSVLRKSRNAMQLSN